MTCMLRHTPGIETWGQLSANLTLQLHHNHMLASLMSAGNSKNMDFYFLSVLIDRSAQPAHKAKGTNYYVFSQRENAPCCKLLSLASFACWSFYRVLTIIMLFYLGTVCDQAPPSTTVIISNYSGLYIQVVHVHNRVSGGKNTWK